jgi:putative copper export protein
MSHYLLLSVHILASTLWTGAYLLLALVLIPNARRSGDIQPILAFERRFDRLGMAALAVLVLSGFWLGFRWLPQTHLWFDVDLALGQTMLAKIVLVFVLVAAWAQARLRLLPVLGIERLAAYRVHVWVSLLCSLALILLGARFRFGGL